MKAVDWEVKHQTKQAKPIVPSGVNTGRGLRTSTLWVYQSYSKYSKISNTSLFQKRYRQTAQTQIRQTDGGQPYSSLRCELW